MNGEFLHARFVAQDTALTAFAAGSMASTASLPPYFSNTCNPNTSIDVLLPAPGTPLMPTRTELPEYGRHFSITSCAMADVRALRSPPVSRHGLIS